MTTETSRDARISPVNFNPPLSSEDSFHDLASRSASLDVTHWKAEALASAEACAQRHSGAGGRHRALASCVLDEDICRPESRVDLLLRQRLEARFAASLLHDEPVRLAINLFPCKSTHPLRGGARSGGDVDVADMACLMRLFGICASLSCAGAPGCSMHIISNGTRYLNVFGEDASGPPAYRQRIGAALRYLSIADCIQIINEGDLYPEGFDDLVHLKTLKLLPDVLRGSIGSNDARRSIIWNIQPPYGLPPRSVVRAIIAAEGQDVALSREEAEFSAYLARQVPLSLARYVAINEVLQDLDLVGKILPDAIQLTVHPKAGQVGIHPLRSATSAFPHNGRGVIDRIGRDGLVPLDCVRAELLGNLSRDAAAWRELHVPDMTELLRGSSIPFATINGDREA